MAQGQLNRLQKANYKSGPAENMKDNQILELMRTAVEDELQACVDRFFYNQTNEFREMVAYPLGIVGSTSKSEGKGKRLRPVLLLATSYALGSDWRLALPAAVAIELVHNFSLVHDDIQDKSDTRRGQPAVWKKWGEAQAINVGDALLAMSTLEMQRVRLNPELTMRASNRLADATFQLTTGQYLDLAFEKAEDISLTSYWHMIKGKTGALLGACFGIAAILAEKNDESVAALNSLGINLGIAFQVQDDFLGVFGDERITGKSVNSDLVERKKTYPILYGLQNIPEFSILWKKSADFTENDLLQLKSILGQNDVKENTRKISRELFEKVEHDYQILFGVNEKAELLHGLVVQLLDRIK